jgi:hypothetical protein
MNLIGRETELAVVREHLRAGKNLAIVGPEGAGKTALVTEAIRDWPGALYCADTSTLKRACESLLAQLDLTVAGADNVARKRAILRAVAGTKRWFVFDHVGRVSPKLLSFLQNVHESHPMIVVARSLAWKQTGHLKMILWDFDRLELPALPTAAARQLLRAEAGRLKPRLERDLLRVAAGNPGHLIALCEQARRGRFASAQLLELDRRIEALRPN